MGYLTLGGTTPRAVASVVSVMDVPDVPESADWESLKADYLAHLSLQVQTGKLKDSSRRVYMKSFKIFDAYLAQRKVTLLTDITPKLLVEFKTWRISNGAKYAYVGDLKALNPCFELALENGLIAKNPIRYESPRKSADRGAMPFTSDELKRMAAATDDTNRLLFWLFYQSGLRKSDAIALKWENLNGHISIVAQKNGKRVRLPILPELKAQLDAERERRNPKPNDFVLLNPATQRPFIPNTCYEHILKLGKAAGVDNAYPHRFRDSFAADAFLRGCSVEDISQYLGDNISTVTKHYSEFVNERKDAADKKMMNGVGMMG